MRSPSATRPASTLNPAIQSRCAKNQNAVKRNAVQEKPSGTTCARRSASGSPGAASSGTCSVYVVIGASQGALRGGYAPSFARIDADGGPQRARHALEAALGDVVAVRAVQRLDVQGDAAVHGKGLEELAHELGVEHADLLAREDSLEDQERPARDVERHARQGLVHRQVHVRVADDALLVAKRLRERLAERDAGVLGGVVLVDLEVARHLHVEIEERMARQKLQHVVEEADPGRNGRLPGPVEGEAHGNISLM